MVGPPNTVDDSGEPERNRAELRRIANKRRAEVLATVDAQAVEIARLRAENMWVWSEFTRLEKLNADLRTEVERLKTSADVAIRVALAWHPSENGPSYHEQLRECRAALATVA